MSVNATAVWRVRPSGANTNGGGYDSGISGAGTDYSQQNSAQASGTHGVTTGTTTFTDATALAFTAAMIGNAIYITGSGQTTGWYFVTGYTSSSAVTLDRSPGTGTLATWAVGGGWADPWTNLTTSGPVVPGNTVYILGSGTPNPSSYTFDYTYSGSVVTPVAGSPTTGRIVFANDPSTPSYKAPPDTTGGMPVIKVTTQLYTSVSNITLKGLWFVTTAATGAAITFTGATMFGCVCDQDGVSGKVLMSLSSNSNFILASEFFSSQTPVGGEEIIQVTGGAHLIRGCNIHDCSFGLALEGGSTTIDECIIAKTEAGGIYIDAVSAFILTNCTIDGNAGSGIEFVSQSDLAASCILNNIISNNTPNGFVIDAGTAAQNDLLLGFVDYNVYYNNTTDVSGINYGPHDTHGGSNPYVNQSTENYTLA